MDAAPNKGDFFCVLHIPHFTDLGIFLDKMEELKNIVTKENSKFYVPGTRSMRNYIRCVTENKVRTID